MSDIEYCKDCLKHECINHEWFTSRDPKTDEDIILLFLERVKDNIGHVFEKVFIIEKVVNDWNDWLIDMGGILEFDFKYLPCVNKTGGRYIPVTSYSMSERTVLDFNITIKVNMMRHHPTELWIQKSFNGEILYVHTILDFMDNLHCESIEDYNAIVDTVQHNIMQLMNKITNAKTGIIMCDKCNYHVADMGSFQPSGDLFLTLQIDRPMNLCSKCYERMQLNATKIKQFSVHSMVKDNVD